MPEFGTVVANAVDDEESDDYFLTVTDYITPTSLSLGSVGQGPAEKLKQLPAFFDASGLAVSQHETTSKDGTRIPYFQVSRKDLALDGKNPTLLYGYGGFEIPLLPDYRGGIGAAWLEKGGVYAVANIRGGAERGESWHRAGMREHKQQSFDDFAAAADWLVATGHTSRDRLAIRGGSNGGLLMGATITQRPDLCRAAQIAVPLLDMVRYPQFLIAELWISEYGNPDLAHELAWLYDYSPYHHVVDGTCYPAVLLTTAEDDSRVDPMHARKMAARLQAATSCGATRPILLRQESSAGHGQGKPVTRQADELADVLAFLWWQLDHPLPEDTTD